MKSLAIEREYGTGGWELGKRIAEIKGIPFFDELGIITEAEKMIQELFQELKETIEKLHDREPAVFVGGAVCGILDKTDDFMKVYLHSSRSDIKSVYLTQHKGAFPNVEISKLMEKKDKQRSNSKRSL